MRFEYNRANETVRKTDQNGTVHEYTYDNLGRMIADAVKTLGNAVDGAVRKIATTFTVTGRTETVTSHGINGSIVNQVRYTYDTNGNWQQYTKNGVAENRIHNAVNEVLNICTHDANGNMTAMPRPDGNGDLECVYDAWNRLVGVGMNIRYRYDGRNFRIEKMVDDVSTKSFFNAGWQEVESRTGDTTTTYVWGLRYIDDLIYREKNGEKRYSLADPNWNMVAVVDNAGTVRERFVYDAFGRVSGLNSDWDRTFTGQVLDAETGLMLYRMRFYHVGLGRFIGRDPIGYGAGDSSLQRYVRNSTTKSTDAFGLVDFHESGYRIRVFADDADTQVPGGHGHIKSPKKIDGAHALKVGLVDGQIYSSTNGPTGKYLPKSVLEKFKTWVKCNVKPGQGGGYAGAAIFVLIASPEIAQAAQENGTSGAINKTGEIIGGVAKDGVYATAAGTGVLSTTVLSGGTFTAGGTTLVSGGVATTGTAMTTVGTVAGVGGLTIAAGAGGYAIGNGIGSIEVGGQSIHTWIGEGMYSGGVGAYNLGAGVVGAGAWLLGY